MPVIYDEVRMKNIEIAEIFYQIAELIEMDQPSFRSRAYEKAARNLESLEEDIEQVYKIGGLKALEDIEGIGKSIAEKIEEYLKTGQVKEYQKMLKKCPVDLLNLTAVEGLGPRKIKILYQKLNAKNLKDLEKVAKQGKIKGLEGFGEKSQQNILQGIEFVKRDKGRFLLGAILPMVRKIIDNLKELKEVDQISLAGSARRMQETIGDADILVTSDNAEKVMDFFVKLSGIEKVWAKGPTRSSVRFKDGFDCDLRVIKKESYGSALQYFTGNKYHNILARRIAIASRLKLNEYGVFEGKKRIAGETEKEVYQALGLSYIEPELRENNGEIEAALRQAQGKPNGLPKVIDYGEIKGDCHVHSNWSDGLYTIEQMAKEAKKTGYQYIVITDHTADLKIAHGLNEERLLQQAEKIDKINKKFKKFKVLKGCEVNIRQNGSLDIDDQVLAKMDLVIASVHSGFKISQDQMTQRVIKAMENPHVDAIGHPTGRVLLKRDSYQIDLDKIFAAAKQTKTALEINAYFDRLDLSGKEIKKAIEAGAKLIIGTDGHQLKHLFYMELGIAQARRGWAEKKDILNALPLEKFLEYFNL